VVNEVEDIPQSRVSCNQVRGERFCEWAACSPATVGAIVGAATPVGRRSTSIELSSSEKDYDGSCEMGEQRLSAIGVDRQEAAGSCADRVDDIPIATVEGGQRGREDAVLFLEDVLAQQFQGVEELLRPAGVGRCAGLSSAEDLFDVAMFGFQNGDVVGEVVGQ
jgi:hypothetical protein